MGPVLSATPAGGGQEEMTPERGDLEQIRQKMVSFRVARHWNRVPKEWGIPILGGVQDMSGCGAG